MGVYISHINSLLYQTGSYSFRVRRSLNKISRSERIPHAGSILVVIVNLWFSVLLNLETHVIYHSKVTNDVALSNL